MPIKEHDLERALRLARDRDKLKAERVEISEAVEIQISLKRPTGPNYNRTLRGGPNIVMVTPDARLFAAIRDAMVGQIDAQILDAIQELKTIGVDS